MGKLYVLDLAKGSIAEEFVTAGVAARIASVSNVKGAESGRYNATAGSFPGVAATDTAAPLSNVQAVLFLRTDKGSSLVELMERSRLRPTFSVLSLYNRSAMPHGVSILLKHVHPPASNSTCRG